MKKRVLILNRFSKPKRPTHAFSPESTNLNLKRNQTMMKSTPDSRLTLTGSKDLMTMKRKKELRNSLMKLMMCLIGLAQPMPMLVAMLCKDQAIATEMLPRFQAGQLVTETMQLHLKLAGKQVATVISQPKEEVYHL